jgi:hypothetical protein
MEYPITLTAWIPAAAHIPGSKRWKLNQFVCFSGVTIDTTHANTFLVAGITEFTDKVKRHRKGR